MWQITCNSPLLTWLIFKSAKPEQWSCMSQEDSCLESDYYPIYDLVCHFYTHSQGCQSYRCDPKLSFLLLPIYQTDYATRLTRRLNHCASMPQIQLYRCAVQSQKTGELSLAASWWQKNKLWETAPLTALSCGDLYSDTRRVIFAPVILYSKASLLRKNITAVRVLP